VHSDPQGVTLPEDVARREANHAKNKRQCAWKQRMWLRSASQAATRAQGEETPFELESSGADKEDEDEEEGEIISSPHSPLPINLPSLGDIFRQQGRIPASARQTKCPWADVGVVSSQLA
jgi:hypothetical protein